MVNGRLVSCVLLGLSYVGCGGGSSAGDGMGTTAGASGSGAAGAPSGAAGAVAMGGAPTSSAGAGTDAGSGGVAVAGSAGTETGGAGGSSAGMGGSGAGMGGTGGAPVTSPLPAKADILTTLKKVNDAWMTGHASPGDNLWARSVYFIGDTEFAKISGRADENTYATKWAASHTYSLNTGSSTTVADNQCAGQSYLALNAAAADPMKIAAIQTSLSNMVKNNGPNDAWWWIDALFMAMPSFVALGNLNNDPKYFDEMWNLYNHTKRMEGGNGLFNATDALWFRDKSYLPPKAEPNGKPDYWARGNGWVFAAHTRVLLTLPMTDTHRAEYLSTFQAMAAALKKAQRTDGFWNVSLADPTHFAGPETSGTSLFLYGFATGVAQGWLDRATYEPAIDLAYRALVKTAIHADGTMGYIQGVGSDPSSSQPVTVNSNADFGVGAFLLGGSAVYTLSPN